MKLRFILNDIEFECDGFADAYEMIEFIYNLTHNNRGKVKVVSMVMEEIITIK